MGYENFSPEADPETDAFHCTPDRIPIFPVRFSLPPYELANTKGPKSIGNTGSYIVRTLRRGYVYIYVEAPEQADGASSADGIWHTFRYSTAPDDINSDATSDETASHHNGSFAFTKYEWSQNYGKGKWTYVEKPLPYCWVPKSASKIWIAYSEFRWPPSFFRKGYKAAFRQKIMQPVNLRGENKWAAYIGKISEIVEEYKPKGSQDKKLKGRLDLSQTGFQHIDKPPNFLGLDDECAAVVALFDPAGDIADMKYRLSQLDHHQKCFHAEYAYPLNIGDFLTESGLSKSLDKREELYQLNKAALRDGWEKRYLKLKNEGLTMLRQMESIVDAINCGVSDQSPWTIGTLLTLACENADEEHKGKYEGSLGYLTENLSEIAEALTFTSYGSQLVKDALSTKARGKTLNLHKILNSFRKCWSGPRLALYERWRVSQYSFEITFRAIGYELAEAISKGDQSFDDWAKAIENGLATKKGDFHLTTKKMHMADAQLFLTGNADEINKKYDKMSEKKSKKRPKIRGNSEIKGKSIRLDQYEAAKASGEVTITKKGKNLSKPEIDELLKKYKNETLPVEYEVRFNTKQTLKPKAKAMVDIPYIEAHGRGKFVGGIDAHKKIRTYEIRYQYVGAFLALVSLLNLTGAEEKDNPLFNRNRFIKHGTGKWAQGAAASVWVVDAIYSLNTTIRYTAHTSAGITGQRIQILYEGAFKKNASKMANHLYPAQSATGRLIGLHLARASVIAGSIVAAVGVARSVEKDDDAETIGNFAMLIGGLMFLPGLGQVAMIVGAVLIIAGYAYTFLSYSDFENVVRLTFWGSGDPYWDGENPIFSSGRLSFDEQIERSRGLDGKYEKYFKEEIAKLAELTWLPKIEKGNEFEHSVIITTPALAEGDLHDVKLEIQHVRKYTQRVPTLSYTTFTEIEKESLTMVRSYSRGRISKSHSMLVRFIPSTEQELVRITASVTGVKTGVFLTNAVDFKFSEGD